MGRRQLWKQTCILAIRQQSVQRVKWGAKHAWDEWVWEKCRLGGEARISETLKGETLVSVQSELKVDNQKWKERALTGVLSGLGVFLQTERFVS